MTARQEIAIKKVLEDGKSVSQAMRESGYSEATAKNPSVLTGSQGWKELMEEHLPDTLLAEKHKELLTTPKKVRTFKKGELETETEELDTQAISKGLELAYKIKDKFAPEKRITLNAEIGVEDFAKYAELNSKFDEEMKRKSLE